MAENKNNHSSTLLLLLGLLFFPIKIIAVYFINCFMDVYKAVGIELSQLFAHNSDQRWGR